MKLLSRILLLLLCASLLASVWMMHLNTTVSFYGHSSYYLIRWPWLHQVWQGSLYGILGWSILFARTETTFVRVGLITVILSMAGMQWNSIHAFKVLSAEKAKMLDSITR